MLKNINDILKHKIIISSTPMGYAKCHNVFKCHFKKLLMFTKNIILAISEHDTLKPLGI